MPSICTQYATVGLHLTVPGMRVLQLNNYFIGANLYGNNTFHCFNAMIRKRLQENIY